MTARVIARISIQATPSEVFRYLQELRYHLLWNPHLQRISSKATLKSGMSYRTTSLLLGVKVRGKNQVTKLQVDQEIEFQNITGALHYRVNYSLKAAGKATTVLCQTELSSNIKAFGFTKPVLQLLAQRELKTDLEALKIAVEQQLV